MTELTDGEAFQLRRATKLLKLNDWTLELDAYFSASVIRNYFNFDMVAVELNKEAQRLTDLPRRDLFNAEKCRLRWSYLHLLVRRT